MTVALYLVLVSVALLMISVLILRLAARRGSEPTWNNEEEFPPSFKDEALALEMSTRIFNPEDLDFVTNETSKKFAATFREERTTLALDWLRRVRSQVRQLMEDHRRTARGNPDLDPLEEFRLFFEFLLFQLKSGTLYCVILIRGPMQGAKFLEWSLQFAGKLRKIAEEADRLRLPSQPKSSRQIGG